MKDQRVLLVGRFGGMNRREATNLIRSYGGVVVEGDNSRIDWVIVGADESPLRHAELLPRQLIERVAQAKTRLVGESEMWQLLGMVELEHSVRRYHTPAMLADLLKIDVQVIRRWQRLGLIKPVEMVHKLPYFDYQEVATAKRLAEWISSGESARAIERRLAQWVDVLPNIGRPLDQLSILVSGKDVLLRKGDGLLDSGGQLRFDFDQLDDDPNEQPVAPETGLDDSLIPISSLLGDDDFTGSSLRESGSVGQVGEEKAEWESVIAESKRLPIADAVMIEAYEAEDAGEWETAIDLYHTILARDGPRADISFQIGELLYRVGNLVAARERYYMAIELDPDLVEARASLGIVLMETGQIGLAISAFQGTLELHEDYADVHYFLARALDTVERHSEGAQHWERFLELAPDSPWANEAELRLRGG